MSYGRLSVRDAFIACTYDKALADSYSDKTLGHVGSDKAVQSVYHGSASYFTVR